VGDAADRALKCWRTAINIDPHFALAHLFLSYATPDPMEAQRERQQAKSLAAHATSGEQLLILWVDGVRENEYLSGIAAMNDLLQQYPQDKHLLVWAGSWLFHQKEYELAQKRLEQAAAIDPEFASPLNDLGYIYAYLPVVKSSGPDDLVFQSVRDGVGLRITWCSLRTSHATAA
jgi:tetratricopeptide (TPR) repeat protein